MPLTPEEELELGERIARLRREDAGVSHPPDEHEEWSAEWQEERRETWIRTAYDD